MFQWESLWGKVRRLARSRSDPATTMLYSMSDIEMAHRLAVLNLQPDHELRLKLLKTYDTKSSATWSPEQYVLKTDLPIQTVKRRQKGPSLSLEDQSLLYDMYLAQRSMGNHDDDGERDNEPTYRHFFVTSSPPSIRQRCWQCTLPCGASTWTIYVIFHLPSYLNDASLSTGRRGLFDLQGCKIG